MGIKKGLKGIILNTVNDNRVILIRLIVGLIFLSERIQKYLFPELLGTGRFLQTGFSHSSFWAYFTGSFEIVCGAFVLVGLAVRLAGHSTVHHYVQCLQYNKMACTGYQGFLADSPRIPGRFCHDLFTC